VVGGPAQAPAHCTKYHPSTASVPITVLLSAALRCFGFNVGVKVLKM